MKNLGKKVLAVVIGSIFFIVIGMMIGYDMKRIQIENTFPYLVNGYTPEKTYTKTIVREFYPGDTLTSNESGAYILWDSTMIRELQVAYVTDSGTIEVLK